MLKKPQSHKSQNYNKNITVDITDSRSIGSAILLYHYCFFKDCPLYWYTGVTLVSPLTTRVEVQTETLHWELNFSSCRLFSFIKSHPVSAKGLLFWNNKKKISVKFIEVKKAFSIQINEGYAVEEIPKELGREDQKVGNKKAKGRWKKAKM